MRYSYLNDRSFLKMFDNENHKIQYTRIEVLDFQTENVIASIEGKSTGGSVNLSGTSNMRRAGSCSLLVDPEGIKMPGYNGEYRQYYNLAEVQNLISMNKKIRIETGFDNSLAAARHYEDYDKLWFPLGVFVIKTASVSKNNSGTNISLTLNDKCALLNGDMGGTIPAGTIFSETEIFDGSNNSQRTVEKTLLKDIIKSLVVEFGGELPENVIITDVPDAIVKVIKWSGKTKLYFYHTDGNKHFTTTKPTDDIDDEDFSVYSYGADVGYMNEPFVYPGTLECNAGESVASVLDKIKNVLGNFEWFYDIDGRFIFQKIKNNLNENTVSDFLNMKESDYLSYYNQKGVVYTFDNKTMITSISNSPQYQNIKNDYVVWGVTKTASGADKPIRYHLAFDSKPPVDINTKRLAVVYKDYKGLWQPCFLKEGANYEKFSGGATAFKTIENKDKKKFYLDIGELPVQVWAWDAENKSFRVFSDYEVCYLSTDDWRTELYYQGLEADNKSFNKNYYAAELNAEWPKIKNIKAQKCSYRIINNFYSLKVGETNKSQNRIIPQNGVYFKYAFDSYDDFLNKVKTINIKIGALGLVAGMDMSRPLSIYLSNQIVEAGIMDYLTTMKGFDFYFKKETHENTTLTIEAQDIPNPNINNGKLYLLFSYGLVNSTVSANDEIYAEEVEFNNLEGISIYQDNYYNKQNDSNYEYWLDLLEGSEGGSESISQFSITNIGRRTKVVTDNNINCIFPVDIPNYVLIEADGDVSKEVKEATDKGQEVIQVSPEIFKNLSLGGSQNSAYEKIKDLIFTHTQYNESVTLSVIPIYYLEPNTLISVFDRETGVYGEYLVKTISLPLTPNGTSNISATRALAKTI